RLTATGNCPCWCAMSSTRSTRPVWATGAILGLKPVRWERHATRLWLLEQASRNRSDSAGFDPRHCYRWRGSFYSTELSLATYLITSLLHDCVEFQLKIL